MNNTPINYLKRLEISGLWQRYDIVWDLNPDVNVLAGINGSGKSTILKYINDMFPSKSHFPPLGVIEKMELFFNDGGKGKLETIRKSDGSFLMVVSGLENVTINVNLINTFDTKLKPLEAVQKLSDNRVETELDWGLYQLQEKYKDYQINIARKKEEIFKDNQGNPFYDNIVIEFKKLGYPQKRLLEIIDDLFSETDKKVNPDKNELEFLLGDKEVNAYQLSSGEKQLLVILLTVLVQDNKPSILLMDEPEISLHMKWQRNLITYIRELNPNVQLIIATHSPDIIMDGWMDKVFNMCDIAKDS